MCEKRDGSEGVETEAARSLRNDNSNLLSAYFVQDREAERPHIYISPFNFRKGSVTCILSALSR